MAKTSKFENTLMDIADFVDSNVYLRSIKDAFTDYVPFIIAGSFGSLLNALIASQTTGLAKWVPALSNLAPAFTAMNFAAVSCMTIPIILLIAMNLAKAKKMPPFITGVLAVICYFAMVPNTITVTIQEATGKASGLSGGVLGAQGLFVGMLVAVLITNLFHWLTSIEKIKIKMPASVPAGIANSFNILIPVFVIIVFSSVFGTLFQLATGSYINEFIYAVVQAPLSAAVQSTAGVVIMAVVCQLFWFLGIHGGLVVEPIRSPISAAGLAENIAAVQAGLTPAYPLTRGFWTVFVVVGGAGLTLSLIFAILMFSKREDHRAIAKLSLLPGICGIGEPMVFGLPLVLNPVFAIPFILNSGIAAAIGLFAIKIGFISCSIVDAPFGLPLFINATISYGWHGAIVQLVILIVGTLTYIPFVLMSNRMAEKKHRKSSNQRRTKWDFRRIFSGAVPQQPTSMRVATRRTEKALQSRILLPMATRNSRAGSSTVSRMDVRERSGWANASRRVHRAS